MHAVVWSVCQAVQAYGRGKVLRSVQKASKQEEVQKYLFFRYFVFSCLQPKINERRLSAYVLHCLGGPLVFSTKPLTLPLPPVGKKCAMKQILSFDPCQMAVKKAVKGSATL